MGGALFDEIDSNFSGDIDSKEVATYLKGIGITLFGEIVVTLNSYI